MDPLEVIDHSTWLRDSLIIEVPGYLKERKASRKSCRG
jgi:hypothetical protein